MNIYLLDKKVLRLRGDVEPFLNGLVSNSLDKTHNAFLNMHGRIIATFEHIKLSPQEFLIIIASLAFESLQNHLDRYLRLNKITMEVVPLNVYFDLDGTFNESLRVPMKKGQLVLTEKELPNTISEAAFNLFRLENSIPLHMIDYRDEMILNVHEFEYVSYTKGCFLGQEPVAKVHNRSKPSWKLTVCFEDDQTAEIQAKMTSKMMDPASNRIKGFAFLPR